MKTKVVRTSKEEIQNIDETISPKIKNPTNSEQNKNKNENEEKIEAMKSRLMGTVESIIETTY